MTEDVDSKSSIGVVGAGIQGVCASLNLIKKGFKVTIIDRDEPGKDSASYGNAGHFSPYASLSLNRPDILIDVPSMLLSTTGPLALKWNYVHKMIPWFLQFIKNFILFRTCKKLIIQDIFFIFYEITIKIHPFIDIQGFRSSHTIFFTKIPFTFLKPFGVMFANSI